MAKIYDNGKEIYADTACPSCVAQGRDSTGNHLQLWRNTETDEKWAYCGKCRHYEKMDEGNTSRIESGMRLRKEWTEEEIAAAVAEVQECPIKELKSRGIAEWVAQRFQVRVGLSYEDGETVISHFYPKTKDGAITAYKVRNLDPKFFYAVGDGTSCDLFGIDQAQMGDIWGEKLFIFEDELSCMSGFQVLCQYSKSTQYKPACTALPDGSKSAASALSRNRKFIESFKELVICMDNDEAGEEAVTAIRSIYPHVKVARIVKGVKKGGGEIKDANDLLMENRNQELNNALRFHAAKERPGGASTVSECMEDALKKPEWGFTYPWEGLTNMTYGIQMGELIAIGAGVSVGKTLLAHEMASHFINKYDQSVGCFMLEETVGNTIKNIAGKSAGIPFHRPDVDYDPDLLRNEAMKYDGKLHLYRNFGQNDWDDIKQCIRFWVVEHGVKIIFLDNITCMVAHLTPSEINTEISRIASELAGLTNELEFTVFVFSHLNAPSGGAPHEEGGTVKEVQFTGSRSLMRYCQVILGFERNKQAEGDAKNYSLIRLLKDRKYGQSGCVYTKYIADTGRLVERTASEVDSDNPFVAPGLFSEDDRATMESNAQARPF